MTDDEKQQKSDLINLFKQVSAGAINLDTEYNLTKRFVQYYATVSKINDYAHLEPEGWFLGPLFMGEQERDWLSTLSKMAVRIYVSPANAPKSILVELVEQLRPFSPLFEDELRNLIRKVTFKADILTPVVWKGEKPFHGFGVKYPEVIVNENSLSLLLELENNRPGYRFPFTSAFLYNTKARLRNANPTGNSEEGKWNTREKFNHNKGSLSPSLHKQLVGAVHHLATVFSIFDLDITPDFSENNIMKILNKNTSAGFIFDTLYAINPNEMIAKPKLSKKAAAAIIKRLVFEYIGDLNRYFAGESTLFPTFPSPAEEVAKGELLNQFLHTKMFTEIPSFKEMRKAALKTRLFYTSGGFAFVFDRIFGQWFSNTFRYYMSAIGIKVEGGGILQLFDMMNGGESCPLHDEWKKVIDHVNSVYNVDLTDIRIGEGDWSKFDFSLLFEVLAHIGGLVTIPLSCPESMSHDTFEFLLTEFIMRLCVKLLYMRGTDQWYWAQGTMNSGEFMTSIGDTVYQIVMFLMYLFMLRERYIDNPVLQIIITSGMIMFFFYGDDHIGRWPAYMDNYTLYEESDTLLHDYINFCVDKGGMTYKWESLKIHDYIYGVRKYETLETGEIVEVAYRPSATFLRYTVAHQFLDDQYMGLQVHRDTEDLVIKLGLSMSATGNPRIHMSHVASLARLASGNLEAFSQLKDVYKQLAGAYGEPSDQEWEEYYSDTRNLPFSVRMVINQGKVWGFPTLESVQKKQLDGFVNRTGFYALDEDGYPVSGDGYYRCEFDPRFVGSDPRDFPDIEGWDLDIDFTSVFDKSYSSNLT